MYRGKEVKMNFSEALRKESQITKTENGAIALNTTGDACLDLFSTIGSLRNADENRIYTLFEEAYKENPLYATKIVFYGRDIREGLGERDTFRILLRYIANKHPEAIQGNIALIGEYGRYDDLYFLCDTSLENDMWKFICRTFNEDIEKMNNNEPISLLAKWLKSVNTSSKESNRLGKLTAKKLGLSIKDYRKALSQLRSYLRVTEKYLTRNAWEDIDYSRVPSNAMLNYRNAFSRHDLDRFTEYLKSVKKGDAKINANTLYPYDLVEKVLFNGEQSDVIEAQWDALPDYVEKGTNALVMADVSGSMWGRPLATSIGLALYFAERNEGAYHNLFMTFSSNPKIISIKGDTITQKIRNINKAGWGMNTDLEAAFDKVLSIAIKNNIPSEEMVKSIIVVSDMEIDYCTSKDWTFYDYMKKKYNEKGYDIPNIVFWNVNSRNDVFHSDKDKKGVQLCSGQSVTVFKQLMKSIGMTPVEMMDEVINSERYNPITLNDGFDENLFI